MTMNPLSRVNTLKCTREELVEDLSSFMSKTNQTFTVQPHPQVTDAVVITADASSESESCAAAAAAAAGQGYVVVGEMCGLAVMRGAEVFSPGSKVISYVFSH